MWVDPRRGAAARIRARLLLLPFLLLTAGTDPASAVTWDDLADPITGLVYRDLVDERGHRPAPSTSLFSLDFWSADRSFPNDAAECSACPKGLTVVDRFAFEVEAPAGLGVPIVAASAALDYALLSFDPQAGEAEYSLSGALHVSVLETSEGAIDPVSLRRSLDVWPEAPREVRGVNIGIGPVEARAWIDLEKLLASHGRRGDPRVVSVALEVVRRVRHVGAAGVASLAWRGGGGGPSFELGRGVCLGCVDEGSPKPPPVPEPGTALLLGLGLAGLAARRARGRSVRASRKRARSWPPLAAVAALLFGLPAGATSYGDFPELDAGFRPTGAVYRDVRDDAGLFGAPAAKRDRLSFSSFGTGFDLACSSCPGGLEATDTLRLELADPEGGLGQLRVTQTLDYLVESTGDRGFASVLATTAVRIRIETANVPLADPLEAVFGMHYSRSNNFSVFGRDRDDGPIEGELEVDLYAITARAGAFDVRVVHSVTIELTTSLAVFQGEGPGVARIEPARKPTGAFLEIQRVRGVCLSCEPVKPPPVVPEPSSALLIALGLGGLARVRRPAADPR